ncbi:MAG: hypothetical protein JWP89_3602 [Schlesneria sp.]|nr:hypothetical protein [Schlesneria sp.]
MPKRKPTSSALPQADTSSIESKVIKAKAPKRAVNTVSIYVNKTSQKTHHATPTDSHKVSPVVQLAQVAGVIPAENLQQLATAVQSGRWLFAVWHVADGRLHLERTATNFPTVDLDKSVAMLTENLKELSTSS